MLQKCGAKRFGRRPAYANRFGILVFCRSKSDRTPRVGSESLSQGDIILFGEKWQLACHVIMGMFDTAALASSSEAHG